MMTALYVFIGVLAVALVIYIFNQFAGFIQRIKRKLDENDVTNRVNYGSSRTPYNSFYGMYGSYYCGITDWRLSRIQDKLDRLDEKIDQILENTVEPMNTKENPEE